VDSGGPKEPLLGGARISPREGIFLGSYSHTGWLGSRVVSMLDSGAEGPGLNRSRDAVG